MPRYSGELARQLAKRFIALYYFHGVFVLGVVKISFCNKFFSDLGLLYIFKHDIHAPKLMWNRANLNVSMLFTAQASLARWLRGY